jgi:carbon-monoxide dehydrogenase medium subunit/2-furoyl-CoA dehydrogenase FAD binding subunit
MKPAPFDYYQAKTIDEAVELLSEYSEDSKIISGGQSLIPMLNFRLARPKVLIDISTIENRNQIENDAMGIRVAGTTLQRFLEQSKVVQEELPILYEATKHIGHVQIRNKGTVGGTIVHADPASELPAISLVLDAEFEIKSKENQYTVEAEDFFITYMTTALQSDEILSSIYFKKPPRNSGWGFHEIARREGDFALAGSAAVIGLDASGKCNHARIALFGVAPTPVRAKVAEEMLIGKNYSADLLKEAAEAVKQVVDPESDVHATEEYRRNASSVLTLRSLEDAFRRAKSV